jgi:hypothetical protein
MRFPCLLPLLSVTIGVSALLPTVTPEPANAAPNASATAIVRVSPVDAAGKLLHGYRVTHRLGKASCQFGSEATGTAYRCFAGNYVIDPCWVTANKAYVDCLVEGWSHAVWRLHVTKGYDNDGYSHHGHRGAYPWGVQTVGGARCGWLEGASGAVGKYRIDYGCSKNEKKVLIGAVDRTPSLWTIRRAHATSGYHYKRDGHVKLQEAWYGKPSRKG